MAKSKNRSRKRRGGDGGWSNEVWGIAMVGGGLLLLLALMSYTPGDLPMGVPFTDITWLDAFAPDGEANSPRHNFVGPVGTLLGFVQIQLFGGAGYLLSVGLIWLGVGRLFFDAAFTWRTWMGFGIFVVSGACLLGVQGFFFQDWPERFWIINSGGVIGKSLGVGVFQGLLNTVGSLIVLSMIYLIAVLLTNMITAKAAALLVLPIAVAAARVSNVSAEPLIIALIIGAAGSFATPFGYQTNMMVYGPGGYRSSDYLRLGVPLSIIVGIVTVIVTPLIWKF